MGRPRKNPIPEPPNLQNQNATGGIEKPIESIDSKLDELSEKVNTEKESLKKPRGKAKQIIEQAKIEEEKKQNAEDFANTISGIGSFLTGLIIERMPNPKPLSDKEAEQINLAFDKIGKKYANILEGYQEESAFIIIVAITLLPRTNMLSKKSASDKKQDVKQ